MNIIVDRPQLVRVVLLYLNTNFGNLTPKTYSKAPDSIFYADSNNEILMEYDKSDKSVFIHYYLIWSRLESLFSLDYRETRLITQYWLDKTYNLSGVTTLMAMNVQVNSWMFFENLNDI